MNQSIAQFSRANRRVVTPLLLFLLAFSALLIAVTEVSNPSARADALRFVLSSLIPGPAPASSFTVISTGDGADSDLTDGVCNDGSGSCTLRAAIDQANAIPGTDTINFSIGSGVKTIVLTADLPIISDPVVIDGTTQPGFAGSPVIEINSNNRSNTFRATLFITAGSSTVKGLVLNRSNNVGIVLTTGGGNHIEGNFIGTDLSGSLRLPNSEGLIVNSSLNTVGGTTVGARNVISGNSGTGIAFNTSAGVDNCHRGKLYRIERDRHRGPGKLLGRDTRDW